VIVSAYQLDAVWDKFVAGHPGGMFEYSSRYRAMLVELLGCEDRSVLAYDGLNQVVGVLPLLVRDGPYGRVLNSQPYFGSHGGHLASTYDAAIELTRHYTVETTQCAAATCVTNPFGTRPDLRGEVVEARTAYFTELVDHQDREALAARFETRTRGAIRHADKAGVQVRQDRGALRWLAAVQDENMRAIGVPAKQDRFFDLVAELPNENWTVWVAFHENDPVAGALLFQFAGVVDYWTPALTQLGRPLQALSRLIFEAMGDASAAGHRLWSWGGSNHDHEGVRRFKRQWNSIEFPYEYRTIVNDETILDHTPDELAAAYPSMYVAPFRRSRVPQQLRPGPAARLGQR
jgi:hypothetical protein